MHIVLTIASLKPGGAERVLSELANHWATQKHRVTVLTLASELETPFYSLHPNITLIQLNQYPHKTKHRFWRPLIIAHTFWRLRQTIKRLRPNVVVSFIDMMNIIVLLTTMGLGRPTLISERIDPAHHPFPRLLKWLRRLSYPLAKTLVVQTKSIKDYFPARWAHWIKIIPNAVSAPSQEIASPRKDVRSLVTVGRLYPQKAHDLLIQAFVNIADEFPKLTLTIYGEGPERTYLESLVPTHLKKRVRLPGTIQDVPSALQKNDLFVFPSRYEGFPNALCEAMALGLPVISSNCSGNRDIVQDKVNGRLFPVDDLSALTLLLQELVQDLPQRQALAQHAMEITKQYSPAYIYTLWDQALTHATSHSRSF